MSVARPEGWRPLAKGHGGENIPELFALFLTEETIAAKIAQSRIFDPPVTNTFEEAVTNPMNNISNRLMENGVYYYNPGSIFMDYKVMRSEADKNIGREFGEKDPNVASEIGFRTTLARFSLDMSTDAALHLARNIVATWDWEEA